MILGVSDGLICRTERRRNHGQGHRSHHDLLFVDGFDAALMKARELAGDGGVSLGGGADLIRQGLAAGVVDELAISTAPLVLGGGKRLFEAFEQDIDLEVLGTWSSQYATHCGTPSGGLGMSTPRTDDRPVTPRHDRKRTGNRNAFPA